MEPKSDQSETQYIKKKNIIIFKVKTLDNNIYEFEMDYDSTIHELK